MYRSASLSLSDCEGIMRQLVVKWRQSPARFAANFGADVADISEKHVKAAGARLCKRLKKGAHGQLSKRADDALMDEIFADGLTRKPAKKYQFRIEAAKAKQKIQSTSTKTKKTED